MLIVVMLSAFHAQFHVIDIILSVVKLNVFMLSVVAPRTDGLHQKLPFIFTLGPTLQNFLGRNLLFGAESNLV
jgi:hypothetical protein